MRITQLVIVFILSFIPEVVFAQQGDSFFIRGTVKDAANNQPIEYAVVAIPEINFWATSNQKGEFILSKVPRGKHQIHCQVLGYEDSTCIVNVEKDLDNLSFRLQFSTLALQEVTVTAQEKVFGSSSAISKEALTHIQPKSLYDVFQLLPGGTTENPNLKTPKQIKIRDISNNPNTALGALLIMDNMPVSNDANMQVYSSSKQGTATATPGTLGQGTDLRDISTESVESVEIIRGIPSAEYGNLTSGVVLVKTKIGETPYRINLKTDIQTKIASIQKGFSLPQNLGALNVGVDFANAYDDIRQKFNGYERLTSNIAYSNTFFSETTPLMLRFNFSSYRTLDENKTDPQLKKEEVIKSKKTGFRTGVNGKWLLRKKWITDLEFTLSGDYAQVQDYNKKLMVISSGAVPFPTAKISGEFQADYLPGVFYSDYTMDGKPYNLLAKLKANTFKTIRNLNNKTMIGVEYSIRNNNGKGLEFDISRPPMNVLSVSSRPRAFHSIPALQNLSAFVENKTDATIGTMRLTLQPGVRLSILKPGKLTTIEPRIIASYELLNKKNNTILDKLSLNAGWGKAVKMPPLVYLSPDDAYFDDIAFNYLDKSGALAIINTTVVKQKANPELKPMTNIKKEIGIELKKGIISAQITFYHEKTDNIYSYKENPYIKTYRKFNVEGGDKRPVFENGSVYYFENGEKKIAPTERDTVMHFYKIPENNEVNIKRGVEFVLNMGKIDMLKTSVIIDGAWLYEKRYNTQSFYSQPNALYQGKPYPYIPIMPAGKSVLNQRFNTNIRTITHIPSIRMVFSLTTQIVWTNKSRTLWEDEQGRTHVYYYKNGKRIDNSASAYDYMDEIRHIDPVAFLDKNNNIHQWEEAYSQHPVYGMMVDKISTKYYFVEDNYPPVLQFNLRMTKEFSDYISASFMINNFFKMHPYVRSNRTGLMVKKNLPLYFGAELNIKL